MFFGIMSISPSLLVPHLIVQAVGLIASFGYFFLYAWSYYYGDLHTQKKQFDVSLSFHTYLLLYILNICALSCTPMPPTSGVGKREILRVSTHSPPTLTDCRLKIVFLP